MEKLHITELNKSAIWEENCCNNNSFGQLKSLSIGGCQSLKFAIPLAMLSAFRNLEVLNIVDCFSMRSEVESSSSYECLPQLGALRSIYLSFLPALTKTRLNSRRRNLHPNLQTLTIKKCKSLRNVFLPSIAKHLLCLQTLVVEDCEMMIEIIGEEENEGETINEFAFPQLTKLILKLLPNFKSFCFTDSVEASQHQSHMASKISFPKLAVLEFNLKTIKLEEIELGKTDSASHMTKMIVHCNNKVQLPSIWQLQFPNMENLSLKNCWCDGSFCIIINKCIEGGREFLVETAEEVMVEDVKGLPNGFSNRNKEAFSNLTKLCIQSCEGMEHVACIPHYEIQQSQPLTYFTHLTELYVDKCSGLKYLFSACVAKCLLELRLLHIENCPTLEVVIRNEGTIHAVIIKFRKLKKLILADLQSLRSLCGENRGRSSSSITTMENTDGSTSGSESLFDGMVTFPALEDLRIKSLETSEIWERNYYSNDSFCQLKFLDIRNCHNLEFAIPLAMSEMFQNLEKLEICECESVSSEVESRSPNECCNELPLVALRSIHLDKLPVLTKTRLNSRRRNLYPNLETLTIHDCNSLRNVFLPSMTKGLLHLRELYVKNCKMMHEIIGEEEKEGERIYEFVFQELTQLKLDSLPNFKSFCFSGSVKALQHQSHMASKVSFPKLVVLEFDLRTIILEEMELGRNDSTSEIIKLVVKCENEEQLPFKWQLQLPNVEELCLKNCLWHGSPGEHNARQFLINPYPSFSFQRLKVVTVDSCGVSALFSCFVFKNLHQLETLRVEDCSLLEEVVREETNIVGTSENTISLLQLRSIELNNLPELKSFSQSSSNAFNMPALISINVCKCPQMENFTYLEISTPLMPDFNTQIQTYLSNPNRGGEEYSSKAEFSLCHNQCVIV